MSNLPSPAIRANWNHERIDNAVYAVLHQSWWKRRRRDIAEDTGLTLPQIDASLRRLQKNGSIENLGGCWFRRYGI